MYIKQTDKKKKPLKLPIPGGKMKKNKKKEKLEKGMKKMFIQRKRGKSKNRKQKPYTLESMIKLFSHKMSNNNVNSTAVLRASKRLISLKLFVDQIPTLSKISLKLTERATLNAINSSILTGHRFCTH